MCDKSSATRIIHHCKDSHTSLAHDLPLFLIFYLIFCAPPESGAVEGDVLASLAPPVHLSGERLGWTLLVCIVNDFRRGHLEVSWSSASEGHMPTTPYSIALTRKHHVPNVVAVITVTTRDWPSYSCLVSRKRHSKSKRRRRITSSGKDEFM